MRLARKHNIPLRQSYARLGTRALRKAASYAHARQFKRAKKEIRRLKTYLGRVYRDILRKNVRRGYPGMAQEELGFLRLKMAFFKID